MKHFIHTIILFLLLLLISKSAICQRWTDSISVKVDSLIQALYKVHLGDVGTTLYDEGMPEGWFSNLRFDTLTRDIFCANSYIYRGKFKYLTNYYFFNGKLIALGTDKVPIKHQDSNKYNNWSRDCVFWNDSLIHSRITNNEVFDYKDDLATAYEILKRFNYLFSTKKFYYDKIKNWGVFK